MEQAQGDKDKAEVLVEIIPAQAEIVFAQIVGRGFLISKEFPAIQ